MHRVWPPKQRPTNFGAHRKCRHGMGFGLWCASDLYKSGGVAMAKDTIFEERQMIGIALPNTQKHT